MSGHSSRPRRRSISKSAKKSFKRLLRSEPLEPRALLSGNSFPWAYLGMTPPGPAVTAWYAAPRNTAPTVAKAISVNNNNNATVAARTASLSVLGRDDAGEAKLVYQWSVAAAPSGGTAAFSLNNTNAAKKTAVAFTKAGSYTISVKIVDAGGLSASAAKKITVMSTAASISVKTAGGQTVNAGSTFSVPGVSQAFVANEVDQFGTALAVQPALTWSATAIPSGASAPSFQTAQGVTTVTFGTAGYYNLAARVANNSAISTAFTVKVDQTLSRIAVSPNAAGVLLGTTQQFTAQGLDQFGKIFSTQPAFSWSASKGTITAAGLFTATASGTGCTVTARSGSVSTTASVTLLAGSGGGDYRNAALGNLVSSLDADGSITRPDMIQLLRSVGGDGVVDANEFTDLKTVLTKASSLNIPSYVQVLAGDVINGSPANAAFQGQSLGNLTAGSSAAQLNKLVDKWFLGADHPVICTSSAAYKSAAGSLFPHAPSHTDEVQGQLGDCYFISALGTLADSNQAAVRNMFIDNGDGTFTVRFYTGTYGTIYNYSDGSISAGFKDNHISVDYVTVDRMLPATASGMLVYADYGANVSNASNSLWIPLAEKAYAQWNETGKEGRDGTNTYAATQGGWMATVDAQVLGYNATDYIMTKTGEQTAVSALAAHKAVTIGTLQWSGTKYGLYANHAYAIIGYNASADTFTLYNPWGSNQPGPLTWSQLQDSTTQMAIADTSGTVPISGAVAAAATVHAPASNLRSDLFAAMPSFRSVDDFFPSGLAATTALHRSSAPAAVDSPRGMNQIAVSRWLIHAQPASQSSPARHDLSASLADATFSDGNLLPEDLIPAVSPFLAAEPLAV
jgi:hypothetical protein